MSTIRLSWVAAATLSLAAAAGPSGCAQKGSGEPSATPDKVTSPSGPRVVAWPDLSKPVEGQRDGAKDAAVIVAIDDYANLADIRGATDNAQDWSTYLRTSRGVPSENVILLQNSQARDFRIREAIGTAREKVRPGGRLWFIFIGHGSPSESGEPLLVGWDAEQTVAGLESRSLLQEEVLEALSESPGTPVALFDACFSGRVSESESLLPGTQYSTVVESAKAEGDAVVLTAAGSNELAGPLPGAQRPAFSYLALAALRGWGDENADGVVTAQEVRNYAEFSLGAFLRGQRSQSPTISGRTGLTLAKAQDPAPDLAPLLAQWQGRLEDLRPACPQGTKWNAAQGNCVAGVECTVGTWNAELGRCVAEFECTVGEWNAEKGKCVAEVRCPTGTKFVKGEGCVGSAVPPAVVPATSGKARTATITSGGRGPDMVSIPAGSFMMGSNDGDSDEQPVHRVSVAAFQMDKTEVTVGQYRQCVHAGSCTEPSRGWGTYEPAYNWGKSGRDDHPINGVDWNQATAFCRWAGKRLPTEEEWEYAARGSDGRTYPWGKSAPSAGQLVWNRDYSQGTAPVGSFPAGASPFGLLDMAGNVREWTSSGYSDNYSSVRQSGAGAARVTRGGSWFLLSASYVRAANRHGGPPSNQHDDLGFRCAR